jgi:hypothetical protein
LKVWDEVLEGRKDRRIGIGEFGIAFELRVTEGEKTERCEGFCVGRWRCGEGAAMEERVIVEPYCAEERYRSEQEGKGEEKARELH